MHKSDRRKLNKQLTEAVAFNAKRMKLALIVTTGCFLVLIAIQFLKIN